MLAWENDCKGITVYRAGSREKEVLVKGNKKESIKDGYELEEKMIENKSCDCDSPNIVYESGCETCKSCGWSACKIA